ncbi:MAG TPA: hypothetical protein VGG41_05930 [Solirubrobacteraceae bacterium]|jgi:hypothetical protein
MGRTLERWRPGYALLLLVAVVCAALVIRDAAQIGLSWATSYDGTDPTPCASPSQDVSVRAKAPLFAADHERIGTLLLRYSPRCATEWGQFVLTPAAEKRLLGRAIEVIAIRPADNRVTVSETALVGGRNGRYGYGNQLGANPCVRAQARLLAGHGQPAGRLAQTECQGLPAGQ